MIDHEGEVASGLYPHCSYRQENAIYLARVHQAGMEHKGKSLLV